MVKIKMEPEIIEGLAHRVWEEKCNINKLCSRQTKGGFISYIVVTSQVIQAMQQPLFCADSNCNNSGDSEDMMFIPDN